MAHTSENVRLMIVSAIVKDVLFHLDELFRELDYRSRNPKSSYQNQRVMMTFCSV